MMQVNYDYNDQKLLIMLKDEKYIKQAIVLSRYYCMFTMHTSLYNNINCYIVK